jgi:hypothetical protein
MVAAEIDWEDKTKTGITRYYTQEKAGSLIY